jgi:hypothetical protein
VPLSHAEAAAEAARLFTEGFRVELVKEQRPRVIVRVKSETLSLPGCAHE